MKEIDGPDDYGSMREAVGRRFQRLMDGDLKFCEVPDLLLIDGGSVHAAAARDTLRELGLELPVYGMVKDDKHRTRALTSPGRGGDRHQQQSGCVRPHRHDTGGDAQVRDRVPEESENGEAALCARRHKGRGRKAKDGTDEAFRHDKGDKDGEP